MHGGWHRWSMTWLNVDKRTKKRDSIVENCYFHFSLDMITQGITWVGRYKYGWYDAEQHVICVPHLLAMCSTPPHSVHSVLCTVCMIFLLLAMIISMPWWNDVFIFIPMKIRYLSPSSILILIGLNGILLRKFHECFYLQYQLFVLHIRWILSFK